MINFFYCVNLPIVLKRSFSRVSLAVKHDIGWGSETIPTGGQPPSKDCQGNKAWKADAPGGSPNLHAHTPGAPWPRAVGWRRNRIQTRAVRRRNLQGHQEPSHIPSVWRGSSYLHRSELRIDWGKDGTRLDTSALHIRALSVVRTCSSRCHHSPAAARRTNHSAQGLLINLAHSLWSVLVLYCRGFSWKIICTDHHFLSWVLLFCKSMCFAF